MDTTRHRSFPRSAWECNTRPLRGRTAFTLVELLVVIVIIGILAALITVAAVQALKVARRTSIKADIDQISTALEEYKNKNGSYPPNVITFQDAGASGGQPDINKVLAEFKRHLKQSYPRHREPDSLLAKLVGRTLAPSPTLEGGMTASEQLVFFLTAASSDVKYPISGEGGMSYPANLPQEPLESRTWIYPFEIARLGPRDSEGFFSGRHIIYDVSISGQPSQQRRINFWEFFAKNSKEPIIYFDTSRQKPEGQGAVDPLAFFDGNRHVHALKVIENPGSTNERLLFANPEKFQILHCGIDDAWGDFDEMSLAHVNIDEVLVFPDGPFVGDLADTLTNFTESTIEDEQP